MPRLGPTLYCVTLLAGLAGVQARAAVMQFRAGYRPFSHAPARVPYSWDMFAIRLDRCVVEWAPPLSVEGERIATWHDRAYPIEFDTIYDHARQYAAAAIAACAFRTSDRTNVTLTCAESDGRLMTDAVSCP